MLMHIDRPGRIDKECDYKKKNSIIRNITNFGRITNLIKEYKLL